MQHHESEIVSHPFPYGNGAEVIDINPARRTLTALKALATSLDTPARHQAQLSLRSWGNAMNGGDK